MRGAAGRSRMVWLVAVAACVAPVFVLGEGGQPRECHESQIAPAPAAPPPRVAVVIRGEVFRGLAPASPRPSRGLFAACAETLVTAPQA